MCRSDIGRGRHPSQCRRAKTLKKTREKATESLAAIYRRTRNLVPANFGPIVRKCVKNMCAQLQSWRTLIRCATCEGAQILGKTGHVTSEDQTLRNVLFTAKTNKKLMKDSHIQRPTNFGRCALSKYGATT